MKQIEKMAEMTENDPLNVARLNCPSDYGMKDYCDDENCFIDKKSCYYCWMEEVEE